MHVTEEVLQDHFSLLQTAVFLQGIAYCELDEDHKNWTNFCHYFFSTFTCSKSRGLLLDSDLLLSSSMPSSPFIPKCRHCVVDP